MGNRSSSRQQSGKMAFCGLIVALSVVLMLSGGVIPVATYCAPMFAGILLLPILLEYGRKAAWTAFAAVSIISLVLGIDKEAAFFFPFLGHYPLLKWEIERIKSKPTRFAVKLAVYNVCIIVMYAFLGVLLHMDAVVSEFTEMGTALLVGFIIVFNLCMMMYDKLLAPLVVLYVKKLRPRLRFLKN